MSEIELTERRYTATRGTTPESYQYIEITQEVHPVREAVLFKLNEQRWRSAEEAADYCEWAAKILRALP